MDVTSDLKAYIYKEAIGLPMSELWKPIDGFPRYEVSNLGRVRSNQRTTPHVLATPLSKKGYPTVCLRHKRKQANLLVHRLVLTAFKGVCPESHECRHLDGDKTNNCVDNLEWSTHKTNCEDQLTHGTSLRGERQHLSKLNDRKVRIARSLRKLGFTFPRLAEIMGVTTCTIRDAVVGNTWKHIAI